MVVLVVATNKQDIYNNNNKQLLFPFDVVIGVRKSMFNSIVCLANVYIV